MEEDIIGEPEFKTPEEEREYLKNQIKHLRVYRNQRYLNMIGKAIPVLMLGTLLYLSWQMGFLLQDAVYYLRLIYETLLTK